MGIAPTGKTPWTVSETLRKSIVRELAQVEVGIGTIKSFHYGIDKPNAKSVAAMARCCSKVRRQEECRRVKLPVENSKAPVWISQKAHFHPLDPNVDEIFQNSA